MYPFNNADFIRKQSYRLVTFLMLLLAMATVSACKPEEDRKEEAAASITGKWYWVKQVYRSFTNDQLRDEDIYTDFSLGSYFEFGKNGAFTEFSVEQNNRKIPGTYRIGENGTRLFIQRDIDPTEEMYRIQKLDRYQLIIVFENTVIDGDPAGQHITYRGEREYTLRRQ